MTRSATEKKKYTYEDYLKLPDDERYELIEGELLMTPSPVPGHQRISGKLEFALRKFVSEHDLGEIFDAPCDVHLSDEDVVQPDILFISKERLSIIGEKNIQGPPDLVIEIISKSSAYRDFVQKKKLYAKSGVKEYWIVIPEENAVEIYFLKDNAYSLYKAYGIGDKFESPLLRDFVMELKSIF